VSTTSNPPLAQRLGGKEDVLGPRVAPEGENGAVLEFAGDVTRDPDYHPDAPGTWSEMVIPLLEGSEVVGPLDFQSEQPFAFALDDVAAGETLAEFIVIAPRNARLYQDARRNNNRNPPGH
jgi:GAF domain-containing protein